jgi:hypothetical protein
MKHVRKYFLAIAVSVGLLAALLAVKPAAAATGEFSVQVFPSPLVATVKPGQNSTLELKIHNNSSVAEDLKIAPRAFKIDNNSQQLQLSDDQLPDIASWISFSAPSFTVQPGQTYTQKITIAVPKDAGFSYAFALIINRASVEQQSSGQTLRATIAVFTLINVDRPDAVRSLQVTRFTASKGLYEYLPAEFKIEFKNTGNTIVQPSGTVYIQRGSTDKTPITTLKVNQNGGYILPGATRTVTAKWSDGFQVITPKAQPDGSTKDELAWRWNNLSDIRVGQYTAKLVAIYDDGHRDVPLEAETTFWIMPWLMLLCTFAVIVVIGLGIWSLIYNIMRLSKRKFGHKKIHF